jgi:nitrogen fixation protein FixH
MTARATWTLAIVVLLAGNVVAMIILAVLANNGGTQVIPDYYAKAAHYDDEMARSAVSRALGWHAEVAMTSDAIEVAVSDAAGQPLDGAQVRITGYPRAHASRALDTVLGKAGPGHYRGALRAQRGWCDLVVIVDAGGAHYTQHVVAEAP